MQTRVQISIFLENRPGALQRVAQMLAEQGINVLGVSVSDAIDHAVVRMVVNDATRADHLLGEAGVLVLEHEVIELTLANEPGKLARVAGKLHQAGININYAYGTTGGHGDHVIFLNTTDHPKTVKVLAELG